MTLERLVLVLVACGLSILLVRSQSLPAPQHRPPTSAADPIRPWEYYGLAIQVDSAYQPVQRYGNMIHEIARLGANTVLFSVNGYQKHAGSADIWIDPEKTPDDRQWEQLFDLARGRGLKIVLMPKVLLSAPRGQEWRGVIDPGQHWDQWFADYRDFIMHYARLAARTRVDIFIVGSELVSAEKYTHRWRALIADIRAVYPGRLTYSANWDHYSSIQFWDALDLFALTSYYQTASLSGPSLSDLLTAWPPLRDRILEFQQRIARPILFTEVGWCSQEGCSVEPWNYYRQATTSPAALEEQRRNYQAFIQTWQDVPQVAGTLWWEWSPGEGGREDHTYTPKNKPAEGVLSRWFESLARSSAGADQTPY